MRSFLCFEKHSLFVQVLVIVLDLESRIRPHFSIDIVVLWCSNFDVSEVPSVIDFSLGGDGNSLVELIDIPHFR